MRNRDLFNEEYFSFIRQLISSNKVNLEQVSNTKTSKWSSEHKQTQHKNTNTESVASFVWYSGNFPFLIGVDCFPKTLQKRGWAEKNYSKRGELEQSEVPLKGQRAEAMSLKLLNPNPANIY